MKLALILEVFSALGLAAICLWEARRGRRRGEILGRDFIALQSTLQDFMKETEATFTALSRSIQRMNQTRICAESAVSNRILLGDTPALNVPAAPPTPTSAAPATARKKACDKKAQVLRLASKGITAAQIASQLAIPRGEIDLILNLAAKGARH